MAKATLSVYALGGGKFAIGTTGKLAKYVIAVRGKKVVGVRGRRPLLEEGRFEKAKMTPEMRDAFKAALEG